MKDDRTTSPLESLRIAVFGSMMGCADAVPGVSGGTVALILGIYDRLVAAISHFDITLVGHVRRRQWKDAARHVDLPFVIALGFGIVIGLGAMFMAMRTLLESSFARPITLAAFLGLILASGILVAKMIRPVTRNQTIQATTNWIIGFVVAFAIYYVTTFQPKLVSADNPSLLYLFVCGAVAICAMILPGISGAMILVLLGVYSHVADCVHNVLDRKEIVTSLIAIAVVGTGCVVGLLAFSRVLRKLLSEYRTPTMAVLCGFIFGALPKLWPFDMPTLETLNLEKKNYVPRWPEGLSEFLTNGFVVAIFAIIVFVIDWIARGQDQTAENDRREELASENE